MSSATPTAPRSPPPRPRPSSPTTGPCPNRSASGGAARRGRPLNKSSPDMCMALEAQRGDPPPPRPLLANNPTASSRPSLNLDSQASIGNQPKGFSIRAASGPQEREDGQDPAVVGGGGGEAELAEEAGDVLLDRALGDDQALGDGGIAAALGHEGEDIELAGA